jgi:hypothetical protein
MAVTETENNPNAPPPAQNLRSYWLNLIVPSTVTFVRSTVAELNLTVYFDAYISSADR